MNFWKVKLYLILLIMLEGLKATASNKAITKEVTPIDNRLSDDIARVGRIINLASLKK